MSIIIAVGTIALSFALVSVRWYNQLARRRLLPPGPKGWPLIGNLLDRSTDQSWLAYAKMAQKYGDIMYLEELGQPMLILSSYRHALELLEKRSANNSDRPFSFMLHDLMRWKFNLALIPYGDMWRRRRRMLHNYFHKQAADVHRSIQQDVTRTLLHDILRDPDNLADHARKHATTIILKITYDHDVKSDDDGLVKLAHKAFLAFNDATKGGLYLVDIIPPLRYLPSWFPGASFRKLADEGGTLATRLVEEPLEAVKQRVADDTTAECFATNLLEEMRGSDNVHPDQEQAIKDTLAVTYAGGADTTFSAVLTFFLAMVLHPEVQKKAQSELDLVVGHDRLPTFDDQADLPYIQCIVSETVRWQPIVPLCVAHQSLADDFYDGYFIPAGTIITPNIWAMSREESLYPDPERFNPDRFMKEDGEDELPPVLGFGFGRRICPGRHLACNTLWIVAASVLAAYSIEKELDENGREITPDTAYLPGIVAQPKPFKCRFVPRSEKVRTILQAA